MSCWHQRRNGSGKPTPGSYVEGARAGLLMFYAADSQDSAIASAYLCAAKGGCPEDGHRLGLARRDEDLLSAVTSSKVS